MTKFQKTLSAAVLAVGLSTLGFGYAARTAGAADAPTDLRPPATLPAGPAAGGVVQDLAALRTQAESEFGSRFRHPAEDEAKGLFQGSTKPIHEARLSLRVMDVVRKIHFREGDRVKLNDELLVLDDREEQFRLKLAEQEAASDVKVRAAMKSRDAKQVELKRVSDLHAIKSPDGVPGASKTELDRAQVDFDLAELEIEHAKFELSQKALQVEYQKAVIARMRIVATMDGLIQELNIKEGEVVDPQKPAITLVNIDRLKVEVFLPIQATLELERQQRELQKQDSKARVKLDVLFPNAKEPVAGEIVFFDPVVNTGAERRRVRLEVDNPNQLPAGMPVKVRLPMPPGGVAAGQ